MDARYATFGEFYPFYLSEHRNPTCRKLHFAGFIGDWVMYWQLLTGKIPLEERNPGARQGAGPA